MTLQDIQRKNQQFQKRTAALADMLPTGGFLEVSTALLRSIRLIDKYLLKLLQTKTDAQFGRIMSLIEEELDESVYILDRIDNKNKTYKLKAVETFLKEGYDLLSIYSLCCDQLLSKKYREDEELL